MTSVLVWHEKRVTGNGRKPFGRNVAYTSLCHVVRGMRTGCALRVNLPGFGLLPLLSRIDRVPVLDTELTEIWSNLESGDVLVAYQHQTNRNGAPWIEKKQAQFERALGIATGAAKFAKAKTIARDVVMLYARKNTRKG